MGEFDRKRKIIFSAEIIKFIHISIILYVLLGWIVNNQIIWYSILVMIPLLQIHWKMNNGVCFLTTIEKNLRNNQEDEYTFVGELVKKYFNTELSDSMIAFIIYFGMYFSALLCIIRIVST
ncbi:MAG: hypothetical protein CMB64_07640 [Euryarchaeota archaeon]|nr:hypothetical protein [Euryarchaeota archaeon]|tara:strand:- start:185 stop:547 length:363 start_codon:yes stop_codon:yes gene_type:complete